MRRGGTALQVRAPQRFYAGLALVGLCLFVLWATAHLRQGSLWMMGPAMFPRSLAVLLGLGGAVLVWRSLRQEGEPLQHFSMRGPVVVTIAILVFAVTIRPLGLAVAGFLTLLLAGFATPEARPREAVVFAVLMTAASIFLFKYLLGMAVPVLIVPGTGIEF